ncbi:putative dnaJ protein-like 1-like [Penaeus vannamei]|uniref:Putative dnaJ protein-like 1-like n=1 Tax=Penaeus vannamei TaxID=6689 RepID=A0A3R7M0E0_PENVA|nr:putative dnaJ protein-like 1-like [Penaeus vannamei]
MALTTCLDMLVGGGSHVGVKTRRTFSFNPHDNNPFSRFFNMDVDGLDGDPPRFRENKGRNQDSAVIRDLYVSLEEVFTGVTKKGRSRGTDKPHPLFKRDGANLVYTAKIPLRDALRGTLVSVPTLTGQRVALNFNRKRRNLKQPDVSKDTVFPIQRIRRGRVILSSTLISNSL